MTMRRITLLTLLFIGGAAGAACSSSKGARPAEAAGDIAVKLMAGEEREAEYRFNDIDKDDRDVAYRVLYDQAHALHQERDYAGAATILRFLARHFESAAAPKEALLYMLFLERARTKKPLDPGAAKEVEQLVGKIRTRDGAPAWVDLAAAQNAVDRNRPDAARAAIQRFESRWDGEPVSLRPYLTEIRRYLETNGGK